MKPKANVLVVDDERTVCNSCRKILTQEGYQVDIALSGEEALRKVKGNGFDVVITDWKMPEIDGMEVLRIVKKNHPDIIVIMITGYPSVESAVKAMRLGVSNYVPKPLDPDELTQVLHKALEDRKTGRDDLLYYQKYIWAKMLDDGTVKIGINNLFREGVGDILYVDLPFNQIGMEQGSLCIRVLASDKQMHKLHAPIRGKVVEINHEINFNTDLINKDPFGKGWIVRLDPFNLEEDLKSWSGNISIFSEHGKAELNSQNRVVTSNFIPDRKTVVEATERPESGLIKKPAKEPNKSKACMFRFLLSAAVSRIFFLALLPVCVGTIMKALFYQVTPQEG
jgi:CheY-like chemotaxis protein/glycine cleavage system H lipoate-binding protein